MSRQFKHTTLNSELDFGLKCAACVEPGHLVALSSVLIKRSAFGKAGFVYDTIYGPETTFDPKPLPSKQKVRKLIIL